MGGLAWFFLLVDVRVRSRNLGRHGGRWHSLNKRHAEPRLSLDWAHQMEPFRRDGAADGGGIGGSDRRSQTSLRSARAWGSIPKILFLSCKTTRTTIFLPIWAVFRRGFDKTPLRAAQEAQVPNGTKGAQCSARRKRAVEHTTSTLDSRLELQRSAWGAGHSARRKYSPRARSFRILESRTNAHVRRERPEERIRRRS